jgi:pimeloyl-ACP methyl ester carboxylesterase
MIYQTNGSNYPEFKSNLNHKEFYFNLDSDVKLHGVLFQPDSIQPIATIFHYSGKGMHLMSSLQHTYEPLLDKGFQIFCFERRDFGKSTGKAINSLTLKEDALFIFDQVSEMASVTNRPIIIWGQSLGGTFATMTAKHRQNQIDGLVLEGTFSSFPDIGKVYAHALNLENFKWIVPIIMNNDFAAEEEIEDITTPTVILHSKTDKEVPYNLGRKLYAAANKSNTKFWEIEGKHLRAMFDYKEEYINEFMNLITD